MVTRHFTDSANYAYEHVKARDLIQFGPYVCVRVMLEGRKPGICGVISDHKAQTL